MRNIAYLVFVLVFVLIGLAIMLRIHIDPRTVMTIQNQIPKIIVGIVLVTFSFSISGLLIDGMYVSSYLIGNVVANAAPQGQTVTQLVTSNSPFDAVNQVYEGGSFKLVGDASGSVTELVNSIFFGPSGDNPFVDSFGQVDFVGGILKTFLSAIIGVLAFIIIAVAVIVVLIRVWVMLLLSYLNILMDIIFAPFWVIAGLLPGSSLGLSAWFRDIVANLAVFPTTIVMLILTHVFIASFKAAAETGGDFFVPPLLGNPTNIAAVSGIIGLGFFFMLPNVLTMVKAALKAPKISLGPVLKPAMIAPKLMSNVGRNIAQDWAREDKKTEAGERSYGNMIRRIIRSTIGTGYR